MNRPALIVDGTPEDWWQEWAPDGRSVVARREWVPVETLPMIVDADQPYRDKIVVRPPRLGDTVTLAMTQRVPHDGPDGAHIGVSDGSWWRIESHPFAIARAAEILPIVDTEGLPDTDADHLEILGDGGSSPPLVIVWRWNESEDAYSCNGEPAFHLPGAIAGGWAIRLTDVEALT